MRWAIALALCALIFAAGRLSDAPTTEARASRDDKAPERVATGERAPPKPGTTAGSAGTGPIRSQTVAAILAGRASLIDGLTEALAIFGPRDPDLISVAYEAMLICSLLPGERALTDPRMGLRPGWLDPQKIWAVDRLQVWCEGFDARAFLAQLDTRERNAASRQLEYGSRTQVAEALKIIGTSSDRNSLATAGFMLLRQDRLPLREIFAGNPPVGKAELISDWILASSLATCPRQLGCGPDAPGTVLYCAQVGCRQGVSYEQALQASLPPRDFRTIIAFRNWIRDQRQH